MHPNLYKIEENKRYTPTISRPAKSKQVGEIHKFLIIEDGRGTWEPLEGQSAWP